MRLRQEFTHRNGVIEYKWSVGYDACTRWREIISGTFKTLAWRDWVRLKTRIFVSLCMAFYSTILRTSSLRHSPFFQSKTQMQMKPAALTFIEEQKKNLRHCPRPTVETEYDQYVCCTHVAWGLKWRFFLLKETRCIDIITNFVGNYAIFRWLKFWGYARPIHLTWIESKVVSL